MTWVLLVLWFDIIVTHTHRVHTGTNRMIHIEEYVNIICEVPPATICITLNEHSLISKNYFARQACNTYNYSLAKLGHLRNRLNKTKSFLGNKSD